MSKQKRDYHIGQRVGRNRTRASLRLYAGILPLNYNPKRRYPSQIHARHPSGPDGQVVPSRTALDCYTSEGTFPCGLVLADKVKLGFFVTTSLNSASQVLKRYQRDVGRLTLQK